MEKTCCICRANFIPTNVNAESRHCCNQCIEELSELESLVNKLERKYQFFNYYK